MRASPRSSAAALRVLPILVVALAYAVIFVIAALQPALAPIAGLEARSLGLVTALFYLTAAILSIAGGRFVARWGPVRMSGVSFAASGLAFLVLAGADSLAEIGASMMLGGVAVALCMPASNELMAWPWQRDQRHVGLQFGIRQAAIPAGALIAGLAASAASVSGIWRQVALVLAVAGVAAAAWAWWLHPRVRRHVGGARVASDTSDRPVASGALIRRVAVAAFVGGLSGAVIPGFLVVALVAWGHSLPAAGGVLTLASCVGIVSRVGWGWLTDRRALSPVAALGWLMALGGVSTALLPPFAGGAGLTLAAALVFATAMGYGGVFNHVLVLVSGLEAARFSGFQMVFVHTGGVLGPLLYAVTLAMGFSHALCWVATGVTMVLAGLYLTSGSLTRPPG